jgi:tRNA threonylcarbamoyladenosine biosynthesis protein TsaE
MGINSFQVFSDSPEITFELGYRLGRLLCSGDVIGLVGELGTGKTKFTQGIAKGLEVDPKIYITSPTYTLINEYEGRIYLYHFDLYRINNTEDWEELGGDEYFLKNGIVIIEWAEKILKYIPFEHIIINFNYISENKREINFKALGNRFKKILDELKEG